MTYYFSLHNMNVENFWSNKTVLGGAVVLISPNESRMMFKCDFVRKRKDADCSVFKIELELNEVNKYVHNDRLRIKLANVTGNSNSRSVTWTSLHNSDNFDSNVEERSTSLKNFWQPEAKPYDWITTKPECNIAISIPKDFIPPYSVADVGAGVLEDMRKMSMFESDKRVRIPEIKKVIFNKPATVVYWKDGTKTTVKCGKDEESFDREKAVTMCFLKKMFKPSLNSHWLDVINDAIQAADDKIAKAEADKAEKARIKAENIAKAEEARRKKAEKIAAANKIEEIQKEIKSNPPKPLEEMPEKKDNTSNKELFETIQKENNKVVLNKNSKVKIDQDLLLECIKEKLTIDEIAEMNSWDKAAVARMYYKITGTKPEKKPNTYSELDDLFEQGVSVDAAARRTGFSKNIVAMRYAKLQNKNNKE